MTPPLITGKYGRRLPKRAPAIQFSVIRRAVLPPVPAAVDYLSAMGGGWQMLGNGPDDNVFPGFSGCGDCVAVAWANTRRIISTVIGGSGNYPGWADVLTVYRTQNSSFDPAGDSTTGPGSPADGGMDIQTLLEWLTKNPGPDGSQLAGFAAVDYTNAAEVQAAIVAGGVLWAGLNVQAANEDEFSAGEPWDYVAGSPVVGGHAVITGGYGAETGQALAGDEKFITWAAESSFTDAFWGQEMRELWFPVWAEQLGTREFQAGVDVAAFAAEYEAITGRPFPVPVPPAPSPVPPVPPPAPVPVPPPGPDVNPDDAALAAAVLPWARRRHHGTDERVAEVLKTWLTAKGFL